MIRVNWGGKRAEKSTGYSCKMSEWNEKTSLLKEGKGGINNAFPNKYSIIRKDKEG